MACTPSALTMPTIACDPAIGGLSKIEIGSSMTGTTWTYEEFEVLPESSTYNSSYTYDKATNVGVWTTTITLNFGEYTAAIKTFMDNLHYKFGRPVKLYTNNTPGSYITIENAKWTASDITPGTAMTDGQTGSITLTAIHKLAPVVTTPTI